MSCSKMTRSTRSPPALAVAISLLLLSNSVVRSNPFRIDGNEIRRRGGASVENEKIDEDAALDAFVNELIEGVSADEVAVPEPIISVEPVEEAKDEATPPVDSESVSSDEVTVPEPTVSVEEAEDEATPPVDSESSVSKKGKKKKKKRTVTTQSDENGDKSETVSKDDVSSVQVQAAEEAKVEATPLVDSESSVSKKSKKKKKKRTNTTQSDENSDKIEIVSEDEVASVQVQAPQSVPPSSLTPPISVPPNALFRFLLMKGPIGHTVITLLVSIAEFVHEFLPQLYHLVLYALKNLNIYDPASVRKRQDSVESHSTASSNGNVRTNERYGSFVPSRGTNKSSSKDEKKRMDETALHSLKRLRMTGKKMEDIKFRHLSPIFMKRYNIGIAKRDPSDTVQEKPVDTVPTPIQLQQDLKEEQDSEDDADWVMEALTPSLTPSHDPPVATSKPRTKKKSTEQRVTPPHHVPQTTSLSSALAEEQQRQDTQKKNPTVSSGPRKNDSQGNLLEKLRAASINSGILSSKMLGAYPGDAVPKEEAGSKDGVVSLARRYGYGDWSDDEEDDQFGAADWDTKKKVRRRKKRKGAGSDAGQDRGRRSQYDRRDYRSEKETNASNKKKSFSFEFEFGGSNSINLSSFKTGGKKRHTSAPNPKANTIRRDRNTGRGNDDNLNSILNNASSSSSSRAAKPFGSHLSSTMKQRMMESSLDGSKSNNDTGRRVKAPMERVLGVQRKHNAKSKDDE